MNLIKEYRKGDRRRKVQIIVLFSLPFSLLGIMLTPPQSLLLLNPLNFIVCYLIGIYASFLLFEGHILRVWDILKGNYKKIWKKAYFYPFAIILYYLLAFPIAYLNNIDFALIWIYSSIILFVIIPSIYSLAIYFSAADYISSPNNSKENRKKVADSLTFLSLALNLPLFLSAYFIILLLNINFEEWITYIGIAIGYIIAFFIIIDLPYYIATEQGKKKKLKELEDSKTALLNQLSECNCQTSFELATSLEFRILRIDRERDEVKSETAHLHGAIKPIASFLVVSVITTIVIEAIIQIVF